MARIVPLDSGPLGLLCGPPSRAPFDQCQAWLERLLAGGVLVIVPAIAEYELRRELIRVNQADRVHRLDDLVSIRSGVVYLPISTEAIRLAAQYWADARRAGRPTADPHALDADVILAAQAALLAGPGDAVTVATTNARHLSRFVDAQPWTSIPAP